MPQITQKFIQVRDINLASALASDSEVEFLPNDQEPILKFEEAGEEFYVFRFKDSAKARAVMKEWMDKDSIDKDPNSPVSFQKAFMHNKNRLLDLVKQAHKRTIVKRGSRIYFVSEDTIKKANQGA